MSELKVSVLMPVYNGASHIGEAIESILKQSFTKFELIIINDGSTDNTKEIINKYNDKRIVYVENQENIKLIATLNKGLQLCTGEYIARMDSDDIAHPERLFRQVDYLNKNKDCVVCGTKIKYLSSGKSKILPFISRVSDLEIRNQMLLSCPIAHPTAMIRSEIVSKYNLYYDEAYPDAEDYNFWWQLSQYGKLHNLSSKLLIYRLSPSQITQKTNTIQRRSAIKVSFKQFNTLVGGNRVVYDHNSIIDDDLAETIHHVAKKGYTAVYLFSLKYLKFSNINIKICFFINAFRYSSNLQRLSAIKTLLIK